MRLSLPESLHRPPKRRNDIIRLAAGTSIMAAEFGYRLASGSHETVNQAVIYAGGALALGLMAMPARRFGANYYGNLRYEQLNLSDDRISQNEGFEGFYANGNSPYSRPFDVDDLD